MLQLVQNINRSQLDCNTINRPVLLFFSLINFINIRFLHQLSILMFYGLNESSFCSFLTILAVFRPFFSLTPQIEYLLHHLNMRRQLIECVPLLTRSLDSFEGQHFFHKSTDKLGEFSQQNRAALTGFVPLLLSPGLQTAMVAGFY